MEKLKTQHFNESNTYSLYFLCMAQQGINTNTQPNIVTLLSNILGPNNPLLTYPEYLLAPLILGMTLVNASDTKLADLHTLQKLLLDSEGCQE
jgi:hypothetical protein